MWEVELAEYGAWCWEWEKILGWFENFWFKWVVGNAINIEGIHDKKLVCGESSYYINKGS